VSRGGPEPRDERVLAAREADDSLGRRGAVGGTHSRFSIANMLRSLVVFNRADRWAGTGFRRGTTSTKNPLGPFADA
jgi:hypothetical protein